MWIIFEGLDKSGKTTLEWELLKATNFKHVVIDRGPVGYMVFDELFNRTTKLGDQQFIHQARKALKSGDFLVVYCKAPYEIVRERLAEHREDCPYDYKYAQHRYNIAIDRFYRPDCLIEIDTSKSIEECVGLIVEKLKEAQKNEY